MKWYRVLVPVLLLLGSQAVASQPNIIWIEADDLMPHFMNKLGDGFGYTPNLDRLATMGTHSPNAVCQGPMCGPSRNGLLTNLYPHNLGLYKNQQMKCMPKEKNLSKTDANNLRRRGNLSW
jgi:iduronate 2-sulfatase